MKRTLVISDIHGCIKQFDQLLIQVEFNPKYDQLILLGDYVDKGPHSKFVVDRVIDLVRNYDAIALRGNHDQRLFDLVNSPTSEIRSKFIKHGGLQTAQSYCDVESELTDGELDRVIETLKNQYMHHLNFLSQLPLYYEEQSHIYVHAGINPNYKDWREQPEHDFMYIKNEFIRSRFDMEKKVIFGHTRTNDIHGSPDIWFSDDKIGIDGGCSSGMQLNCLIIEDGKYKTEHIKFD